MAEQGADLETLTVELVGYRTTQDEVFGLYQEVYQLRRTPVLVPGSPEVAEQTPKRSWTH